MVGRVDVEVEPLDPALAEPHLLGAGGVRDLGVLHAGGVPDQPGDGVGVGRDPVGELLVGQSVDGRHAVLEDPLEEVDVDVCWGHAVDGSVDA